MAASAGLSGGCAAAVWRGTNPIPLVSDSATPPPISNAPIAWYITGVEGFNVRGRGLFKMQDFTGSCQHHEICRIVLWE